MNETDPAFPTGPWTGFFAYDRMSGRERMDLTLEFAAGRITGEGADWVGPFIIDGNYDVKSRECCWHKSYVGQHDVWYRGVRQGKGISGRWEITNDWQGGFHIWPITEDGDVLEADEATEPAPLMVSATEV